MEQKTMHPARVKVKAWWDLVATQPHLLCSQQDSCFFRALLHSCHAARVGQVWAVLPVWPHGIQIHIFNSTSAQMQRWNCWFVLVWGITASPMKNAVLKSVPSIEIYIFPSTFYSSCDVFVWICSSFYHLPVLWWLRYAGYSVNSVSESINGWLTVLQDALHTFIYIFILW